MGHKFNCDLCFADIPIAENIQKIEIGGSVIAEACLTCAQQVKSGIQETVTAVAKKMAAAQQAAAAPAPKPEAPTVKDIPQLPPQPKVPEAPRDGPAPAN